MKRKNKKKIRKKTSKKRKVKANSRRSSYGKTVDLQKVISFKFQTISKAYENFKKKRGIEKLKQEKLRSKNREKISIWWTE